jgi:hypothetical protein
LLEVSNALFELRDALMELSLALNDWLFESDTDLRARAKANTDRLLAKVAAESPPKFPPIDGEAGR